MCVCVCVCVYACVCMYKASQRFCSSLICASLRRVYHVARAVQAMLGSIVIVDALTRCTLLHSICDLKASQMNVQLWEHGLNEFGC